MKKRIKMRIAKEEVQVHRSLKGKRKRKKACDEERKKERKNLIDEERKKWREGGGQ